MKLRAGAKPPVGPVPLLADESIFGPEDMTSGVREEKAYGVAMKIIKSGGLSRAQTTARITPQHGWTTQGGDMHETGLAYLAGTQMIAATSEIALGCEFYHASHHLRDDILSEPFANHNGRVLVSDALGPGIAPDVEKIDHVARARG